MLSNAKIGAVVPVTNVDRARKFYEGVLGLTAFMDIPQQGTVIYQSAGTTLTVYQRPTASSGEHTIASFQLQGGFDAVVDGLIARGITFDTFEIPDANLQWDSRGVLNDGSRASAWFKDPDGNVLNIIQLG